MLRLAKFEKSETSFGPRKANILTTCYYFMVMMYTGPLLSLFFYFNVFGALLLLAILYIAPSSYCPCDNSMKRSRRLLSELPQPIIKIIDQFPPVSPLPATQLLRAPMNKPASMKTCSLTKGCLRHFIDASMAVQASKDARNMKCETKMRQWYGVGGVYIVINVSCGQEMRGGGVDSTLPWA
jgi:hypothetical protein